MKSACSNRDGITEIFRDRLRDRLQVEIGGRWQLMPGRHDSWRQWAFDPFAGLTLIGQDISPSPRKHLPPDGPDLRFMLDYIDGERDPGTGLIQTTWISRVFWLRFGCRILGLDVGFGIYWRRGASDKFLASVDTHAQRGDTAKTGAPSPMGSAVPTQQGDAPPPKSHPPLQKGNQSL